MSRMFFGHVLFLNTNNPNVPNVFWGHVLFLNTNNPNAPNVFWIRFILEHE